MVTPVPRSLTEILRVSVLPEIDPLPYTMLPPSCWAAIYRPLPLVMDAWMGERAEEFNRFIMVTLLMPSLPSAIDTAY